MKKYLNSFSGNPFETSKKFFYTRTPKPQYYPSTQTKKLIKNYLTCSHRIPVKWSNKSSRRLTWGKCVKSFMVLIVKRGIRFWSGLYFKKLLIYSRRQKIKNQGSLEEKNSPSVKNSKRSSSNIYFLNNKSKRIYCSPLFLKRKFLSINNLNTTMTN
jgi:hypothetical protein